MLNAEDTHSWSRWARGSDLTGGTLFKEEDGKGSS